MKKYKLYKIQPFNHDYKIIDISKKEYERLKVVGTYKEDY